MCKLLKIFIIFPILLSCHVEHQQTITLRDRQMETVKAFMLDIKNSHITDIAELYFSDHAYEQQSRLFENDFNIINCYMKTYGLENENMWDYKEYINELNMQEFSITVHLFKVDGEKCLCNKDVKNSEIIFYFGPEKSLMEAKIEFYSLNILQELQPIPPPPSWVHDSI